MKTGLPIQFLLFLLLLFPGHIQADTDHTAFIQDDLLQIIRDISQRYDVHFTYDREIVEDVEIETYTPENYVSVDDALSSVLAGTNLKYVMLEMKYVIIYQDDAEGMESLEQMVEVLGKIIEQKKEKRLITSLDRLESPSQLNRIHLERHRMVVNVSGTVTDEAGEPLIGVNVLVDGSNQGTATDLNGQFILEDVNENATLIFSYIGYQTLEFVLNGRSTISITMVEDLQTLDEVVIVGYGTQKKENLTGSVSTVDGSELTRSPLGQTTAALQGLAPGVTIRQQSGKPGNDGGEVRIRGIGTLGNSNPLVMVDGVSTDLNNVDPNDIESISVLKDATSAAIYGSRAANGVILITTKRAEEGKISVNYNNYVGLQSPTNLPKLVNALDHMLLFNEAQSNVGQTPSFTDAYIEDHKANSPSDLYPDTDWQKEVLTGSGFQQNHYLGVNAGNEMVKFYGSLSYFDQKGIIPNTSFKRYSTRLNTDVKFSEKFKMGFDILGRQLTQVEPSGGAENVVHWMNRIPATQGGRNSDGTYGEGWNGDNPIAKAEASGTRSPTVEQAIISIKADYQPYDWLNFNLLYSPNFGIRHYKEHNQTVDTYFDGQLAYTVPSISSINDQFRRDFQNTLRGLVTINKDFDKHDFKILVGYEQIDFNRQLLTGNRQNLIAQEYNVIDIGSVENQTTSGTATDWALQSYFGRLNYIFEDKYLAEFNIRYDGSSRFSTGNQFGVFPSASLGWRFSEETFMDGLGFVDLAKFRISYGQLGNQNIGGNYPFASSINLGINYSFANSQVDGAALVDLSNPFISWETSEVTNFGLDLGLFGNRFNLTAEYYIKYTNDILLQLPIPETMGLTAPFQNAGSVTNKGWDLNVGFRNHLNDFKYNIQFILSDVQNEINSLKDTGPYINGGTIRQIGEPIDALFGYESLGLFQSQSAIDDHVTQFGSVAPGDLKYKDQNGDGLINGEDRVIIGNQIPRLTFSLNLYLDYKGFDLNMFFQGVGKAQSYLSGHGVWPFHIGGTAQEMHKDRWSSENPDGQFPRLAFNESNNEQISSFWVKEASYLRFKTLQIGYSLPPRLLDRLFIQNVRLFIGGQNLFTIDSYYDGFDVEAPIGNGSFYPIIKTYTAGLNVKF